MDRAYALYSCTHPTVACLLFSSDTTYPPCSFNTLFSKSVSSTSPTLTPLTSSPTYPFPHSKEPTTYVTCWSTSFSLTSLPNLACFSAAMHAPSPPVSPRSQSPIIILILSLTLLSNVIYCITCLFSPSLYISQKERRLAEWYAKHFRDIRLGNYTSISRHFRSTGLSLQHMSMFGLS